jgi:acyl carrier protein
MDGSIQDIVKAFLLEEFLEGEDPAALGEDTELITSGVLDSLATLKLVTFLEQRFGIQVQAHEADADHLNTLRDIEALVRANRGS